MAEYEQKYRRYKQKYEDATAKCKILYDIANIIVALVYLKSNIFIGESQRVI